MKVRYILGSVALGAGLGTLMIITHFGPGIHPASKAPNTPSARNALRVTYVNQLASGLQQYHKDHGPLPIQLTAAGTQICTSSGANCISQHLADLSFLTTAGNYIVGIPEDPLGGHSLWGSGFTIAQLPDGNARITATKAESGKTITATAQL
jgi:hypothetical protein